ncbi:MAG: hypothetical protein AAF317_10525, partial [Pseudomonadota bacterium]
ARKHCASEWIVSNWCFLVLTAGWLCSSLYYLLFRDFWNADYQFSALVHPRLHLSLLPWGLGSSATRNPKIPSASANAMPRNIVAC